MISLFSDFINCFVHFFIFIFFKDAVTFTARVISIGNYVIGNFTQKIPLCRFCYGFMLVTADSLHCPTESCLV